MHVIEHMFLQRAVSLWGVLCTQLTNVRLCMCRGYIPQQLHVLFVTNMAQIICYACNPTWEGLQSMRCGVCRFAWLHTTVQGVRIACQWHTWWLEVRRVCVELHLLHLLGVEQQPAGNNSLCSPSMNCSRWWSLHSHTHTCITGVKNLCSLWMRWCVKNKCA